MTARFPHQRPPDMVVIFLHITAAFQNGRARQFRHSARNDAERFAARMGFQRRNDLYAVALRRVVFRPVQI
jgi:hypothetical protein